MSSSVPGQGKGQHNSNASSSRKAADAERSVDSADSEDDLILDDDNLLDADPLRVDGHGSEEQYVSLPTPRNLAYSTNRTSFKRSPVYQARQKSKLVAFTPPSSSRQPSPSPQYLNLRARSLREQASQNASKTSLGSRASLSNGTTGEVKGGGPLDWYVEGPGRRVGYDDLTAIDWIFEYSKERQRLRILASNTHGLVGYFRQLLDASHVWIVLILTGVTVGILAAAINIASDWLGDIKFGFCKQGEQGGQFYLNKGFCCWGHDGSSSLFVSNEDTRLTCYRSLTMSRLDAVAAGSPHSVDRRRIRG